MMWLTIVHNLPGPVKLCLLDHYDCFAALIFRIVDYISIFVTAELSV